MNHDHCILAFDGYVFSKRPFGLSRDGRTVDVPRQSLELLDYLIAHRDRVATREELIERFWSLDHASADQSLNTCVRRLRRALEASGDAAYLIETHQRVGYRFVGEIDPVPARGASAAWHRPAFSPLAAAGLLCAAGIALGMAAMATGAVPGLRGASDAASAIPALPTAAAPVTMTSIAVPPGRNMCETVLFPMFLEGLQENLMAEIYRASGEEIALLRVASHEAAERHDVAQYYLDLGVRQMPDRTIANLSLVSIATGEIAWTAQIDEPTDVENYLSTQEALSARLAEVFVARER